MYSKTGKQVIGRRLSSPQWREMRRTILMEIIQDNPHQYWSAAKLAQAGREHPVLGEIQPNYGSMTAWRDWKVVREELKQKRDEIATEYIDYQLETIDNLLEDLLNEYEKLDEIDLEEMINPSQKFNMQLRITSQKRNLVEAMDRLFSRQQTLLPMAVPKEVKLDQRSITMNLDNLLEAKKKALALEDGNTIDGEIVAVDD